LRRNGIELDLQLSNDLPPFKMNPDQLQQVVVNIVLNTVDAMPKGGRLVVASRHVNRHIQVTFEDTGCGIAPDQIDKIFLPFFTTKEIGKGTGLGLSISYGIVKDHGGDIQVSSQVGQGSTFSLSMPVD
jgi:signal transduction histidine kinase